LQSSTAKHETRYTIRLTKATSVVNALNMAPCNNRVWDYDICTMFSFSLIMKITTIVVLL
jgi:hypothetical protein